MGKQDDNGTGNLKIGLATSVIVIVVLVALNIWVYSIMLYERGEHSHYRNLAEQISSEKNALQSTYDDYVANHHYTDSEYDALKAPKLSDLSLFADDSRPWLSDPYLHVHGEVWNVGTDTAYDCRIHVRAFQGAVLTKDTYIWLGTIHGGNKKSLDEKIYYSGSALTEWHIILEWG